MKGVKGGPIGVTNTIEIDLPEIRINIGSETLNTFFGRIGHILCFKIAEVEGESLVLLFINVGDTVLQAHRSGETGLQRQSQDFISSSEVELSQPDTVIDSAEIPVSVDPPVVKVAIDEFEDGKWIEVPALVHRNFHLDLPLTFVDQIHSYGVEQIGIVDAVTVPLKHAVECCSRVRFVSSKTELPKDDSILGFPISLDPNSLD